MHSVLSSQSDYSFMKGASTVKALVSEAAKQGVKAFALTDRNNMFGALKFADAAKEKGIQPIMGAQLPLMYNKDKGSEGFLTLLAQNEQGYKNICRIMKDSQEPQPGRKSDYAINATSLTRLNAGIIVMTGGHEGALYKMLREGEEENALKMLGWLHSTFKDRLYIQISRNSFELTSEEIALEKRILDLAADPSRTCTREDGSTLTGIPVAAIWEVRYATEDRHAAHEILDAMETKKLLFSEGEGMTIALTDSKRYHILNEEDFKAAFADLPFAVENAQAIPQRCGFMAHKRKPILPSFPTGEGRTEAEELRVQAAEGLKYRLSKIGNLTDDLRAQYEARLEYELGIIEGMGFPGYFLIVSDFIKWAKKHDIPVGPGRGSGAGSLVAYALLITDIDPFPFGLLFERFLNPERVSMPDFDVDFCTDGRDEVIRYVRDTYGKDRTGLISTFAQLKSKNALKDTAKIINHNVYGGYGFGEINNLTKMIPKGDGADPLPLKEAFTTAPELIAEMEKSPKIRFLYQNALHVEGLLRSAGSHAAGVVIGDRPLDELIPVRWDNDKDMLVSQFDMKAVEPAGLVKFDFLGLKNLSVIKEAVRQIKVNRGIDVDISAIPLDDDAVFAMIREARTIGVFQFESGGMQNAILSVKPTRLEDLIAINALFRPGPMEQIPLYAAIKNGEQEAWYPNPVERTKPFLEETYGIMIYQEQVMKVAQEVAGYSLGGADILRRAMGKKNKEEMDAQKSTFVKGAVERGTPEKEAAALFETIEKFAGYGFNKSHAAAYAYIAYQTAWLKCHYGAEFFAALLSYESDAKRMAMIKDDMEYFGIRLLPPDINRSNIRFTSEPHRDSVGGYGIRFGLGAIKNISSNIGELVKLRENGAYTSLGDFAKRAVGLTDSSQIQKLTEAGAFDGLNPNRNATLGILNWYAMDRKKGRDGNDLFGGALDDQVPAKLLEAKDWGDRVRREFDAVGFFFNNHPLDTYTPRLMKANVKRVSSLQAYMVDHHQADLRDRKIAVMVDNASLRRAKSGKMYLSARISEKNMSYDMVMFGRDTEKLKLAEGLLVSAMRLKSPVIVSADFNLNDAGQLSIYANEVIPIDTFLSHVRGNVVITLETNAITIRPDEAAKKAAIDKDLTEGNITQEQADDLHYRLLIEQFQARIQEVQDYLKTLEVADHPNAVEITLELRQDGVVFESGTQHEKHLFTAISELTIKSMDGVVSLREAD